VPLFAIHGPPPDDVEVLITAPTPMMALRAFHAEGFGGDRQVRLIEGSLVFRRSEDQAMVVGEWHIVQQSVNGGGHGITTVVRIDPPDAAPG
jgi:hypothetical protein